MSVPSPSVLQFLRSQPEQAHFFTPGTSPSTRATACPASSCRGANGSQTTVAHVMPSARRHLATSLNRQASVESSLPNFDFLRPCCERGPSKVSTFASRNSAAPLGILAENTSAFRYASTDTRPLWKRPWKKTLRKENIALKTSETPALPSFLDDAGNTTFGRRKTVKGSNELRLRCTEFDENGNVTFMDGEFKKSELIAKVDAIDA